MKFNNKNAEIFIPDNMDTETGLSRTTHLTIAAHHDDIEIMSYDGILQCFGREDQWFSGVVITNGSGSPRDDLYASYTDEQMQVVRVKEQKKAAYIGEYAAQVFLQYASSEVKDPTNADVVDDIKQIITAAKPKILYTHNLADKHDTHVAVVIRTINALRELSEEYLPEKVYGCEVWRDLDWMPDDKKVIFDISSHENIGAALMGVFDSQICGGKRYDLAMMGRRHANATFSSSHTTDTSTALSYAMDLTPLIKDKTINISDFLQQHIEHFCQDVTKRLKKML